MSRIISVSNFKGGSGKTTTAVNISACRVEKGKTVLLVDLDPAANATWWMNIVSSGQRLYEAFFNTQPLSDAVQSTDIPGLDIIASGDWMVKGEQELKNRRALKEALKALPDRWDYIMVDPPPALNILSVNALTAAQRILIVVEAHVLALNGLKMLFQSIQMVKKELNPSLEIAGIVACRVDLRTRHAQAVLEDLKKTAGKLVMKTFIRENVRLAECPSFKKPINKYAPKSYGAEDYRALADEIIRMEVRENG